MKFISSYFILIVLALNSLSLNQFAKFHVLVHHYNEHCSEDHSMTFTEFVRNHYFDLQHPDDEHNDHENLPFKSPQQIGVTLVFQNLIYPKIGHKTCKSERKSVAIISDQFINDDRESGLLRPPIFVL